MNTQPDPTAAAVRAAQAEAEALREAADALDTRAGQLHEACAEAKRGLRIGSGLLRDRADRLACCDGTSQESASEVSDAHTDTAAPVAVEGVETVEVETSRPAETNWRQVSESCPACGRESGQSHARGDCDYNGPWFEPETSEPEADGTSDGPASVSDADMADPS